MSRTRANLLLLFAAALWGFGNVSQKMVLVHLDALSAVGLRCLIGGLLVLPFVLMERRLPLGPDYFSSLAKVCALFAISITLQQLCYLGASVTNASFLVSTATVMTPLAAWFLVGERPTASLTVAAGLTVVGALLLSDGIAGFSSGDLTAVLSAACYALWAVELGRHMQVHARPFTAAATQFFGAAAFALPLGAMQGNLSLAAAFAAGPELAILGVFSTAIAFGIQTVALRFTPASHAAVIVSAESVFGALGAAIFLGERSSSASALGAAIILGAILSVALSNRAPQARTSLRTASVQPFDGAPAFAAAAANWAGDRHPNNSGPVEECDDPCR
ncbi:MULTISPECIES: DMT family transporter [unclassified Mesorhizobium]|uniref:DMT family transporter n=1 Tax=unclassified Mesorhizobium TaxID=325217 RepID=UPI000FCB76B5|nr:MULTISPECIES: DMT family transporter [unclassified Mesorhizobium]RUU66702.1 DMT family transporter [Mesorhizobium sp. M7A.T.Ca.TU.009.01.1.1]RUU82440.1 DMT family transporter [Mesorhizobium sp. M7A.T.Ca.TU.009.01.1.2]AZV22047.1 DMT family transporter [Mesorhizobium sp. M7A.F.Ce.TU.012.03.2.1]RUT87195.1 DMT family transporter [Mesorhizobium sp. M7A.T.Ca.US.000.02.1.1]RUT87750.1 DMT family transporter [Mesorhizobium sp. M7A.T.Ca.US.000.02.2.1]